jgi:hypothetical protein
MSISKEGIVLRVAPYRLGTSVLEFIVESSVGDDEFDLHSTLIAKSVVASVHQLRRRVPDPLHSDTLIGSAASCLQQYTYLCASPRSQELDPSGGARLSSHRSSIQVSKKKRPKLRKSFVNAFPLLATVPFLGPDPSRS